MIERAGRARGSNLGSEIHNFQLFDDDSLGVEGRGCRDDGRAGFGCNMPSWTGKSRTSPSNSGSSGSNVTHGKVKQTPLMAVPPIFAGAAEESSRLAAASTCVEPDHRELIRSVATVLYRRIRDNETADSKVITPLFCEDTHTEPEPEDRYEVTLPLYHQQLLSFPTLYIMRKLPPLKLPPPNYPVPSVHIIATFIENIRQKARLTPQSMVITLIYIDRLEARSEGVLLHARSWRPVVFASLLLASKVWHDISYWNSDFQSICPMFNVRNINRMVRGCMHMLTTAFCPLLPTGAQHQSYGASVPHAARVQYDHLGVAVRAVLLLAPPLSARAHPKGG